MCSNCKVAEGCGCSGGSVFAMCPCEKGLYCSVCGHYAGTAMTTDPRVLEAVLKPAILEQARKKPR
jgi:hypothetical protein